MHYQGALGQSISCGWSSSVGSRHLLPEQLHPFAQVRCFLKVEVLGRLLHLGFELIDQLRQRLQRQTSIGIVLQGLGGLTNHLHQIRVGAVLLELPRKLQEGEDRIAGLLARRHRHHAVLLVVGLLDLPAPLGFGNGLGHRIGHVVGIEQRHPLHVPGSSADGLDQRALGPQEAFLVGIEDRHQAHLRQVQTFPQQVHPHQHVIFPQA